MKEIDEIQKLSGIHPLKESKVTEDGNLLRPEALERIFAKPPKIDPDEPFILRPDPIMRLSRCLGMNPKFCTQSVQFMKNPRLSNEVVYGTANMIVCLNVNTGM